MGFCCWLGSTLSLAPLTRPSGSPNLNEQWAAVETVTDAGWRLLESKSAIWRPFLSWKTGRLSSDQGVVDLAVKQTKPGLSQAC